MIAALDDADCRALWLSVLRLAAEDRDVSYFNLANPGFREVCQLSGLDPAYVLKVAEAQLREPNRRRNPIIARRKTGRVAA